MNGRGPDVCGVLSDRIKLNTENESRMVMARESFSPDSTGTQKVKADRMARMAMGMMMFRR